MTHCIMQNNAVDIYQDYFEGNASWGASGPDLAVGTPSRSVASMGGSSYGATSSMGDSELDAPSAKIVAVFKDFSETTAGACGNSGDRGLLVRFLGLLMQEENWQCHMRLLSSME